MMDRWPRSEMPQGIGGSQTHTEDGTMATMTWYEDEINDLTGFANGDKFTSDEQVRE